MPRKIEISLYKFNELSDRAKEKARDWYRQGALDYEWWDSTYEDAKNIGLRITGFDIDRGPYADGEFTENAVDVAEAVLKDHGKSTETYKDAKDFLGEYKEKEKKYYDENDSDDFDDSEIAEELKEQFLHDLLHDYAQILQAEVEYLMSDEQVDEACISNEYEFHKDGSRA